MTDEQCKRYKELLYRVQRPTTVMPKPTDCEELAEMRKMLKFSDMLRIEWFRDGRHQIPQAMNMKLVQKDYGARGVELAKEAIAKGYAQWDEHHSHGMWFSLVRLTDEAFKQFKAHYTWDYSWKEK